ncbi:MAG: sodium:dicarboxylate symporter [Geminicoccaceae bacterium]|nr:sodium:dicarboxylate symporter [Geminicoccaceae bacterium]
MNVTSSGAPRDDAARHVGRVALALVAGMVVGIAAASAREPMFARAVGLLEPIGLIWVNAIRMTVVPLVVALLLQAVSRDSEASVGRVGGLAFITFVALHVVAAVLALLIVAPILAGLTIEPATAARLQADATAAASVTSERVQSLPGLGQWVASLAPANVVRAAADGAMLPLIVFTVLFGLALRRIVPERRDAVMRVIDGIGAAMLEIVRWLIRLAPVGVFTLIAPLAARLGLSLAGALGYYVVAYIAGMLILAIVLSIVGALGGGVSPLRFIRAVLPAQAVAFSSSSSLASLPALIDSARRLGIAPPVGGLVLPLAVSSFKVASAVSWLTGTMFLARLYGVELALVDQLTIVASAIALSFATPGVPNGAFLLLAPLLVSVGLPASGVALLIAIDSIPDLFATTTNVTGDFAAAAIVDRVAPADHVTVAAPEIAAG